MSENATAHGAWPHALGRVCPSCVCDFCNSPEPRVILPGPPVDADPNKNPLWRACAQCALFADSGDAEELARRCLERWGATHPGEEPSANLLELAALFNQVLASRGPEVPVRVKVTPLSVWHDEYVEYFSRWLVDAGPTSEATKDVASAAREGTGLDGVYRGKSAKIHRLVRLAYLRGVRRGVGLVWHAHQRVSLRGAEGPGTKKEKA